MATSYQNIAAVYQKEGKRAPAIEMATKAYDIKLKVLGRALVARQYDLSHSVCGFLFFFFLNCLYFIFSSIARPEQTGANLFDETVFDGDARNRLHWVSHRLPAVHALRLAHHARACAVRAVFR